MTDLSAAEWEKRYDTGNTPWDLGGPTPELIRLKSEKFFPCRGRALVPGGGRGHDAIFLAQCGLEVDLVDFAPSALQASLALANEARTPIQAYRQDFFALPKLAYHQTSYDLIWEYTFFCAIDPSLREKYARTVHALLKPTGIFLALFFPTQIDKAGPPFPVSRQEIESVFAPYFDLKLAEPRESVKPRRGREILGMGQLRI